MPPGRLQSHLIRPLQYRDALAELKDQTHHHGKIVRPTELIRAISMQNPSLASGQQQDAAEALEVMLAGSQNSATHADQERGEAADVLSCLECGARSATSRTLAPPIIQVPVTAPSLDLCLSNLLAPQPLDGRRCVQCQTTSSVLSAEFLMTPQAMALQLLRFRVTSSEVEKNASSVRLAPLTRLDGINWNITGVVNHSGTPHQGHYTAYVRYNQRWFL